jgi:hypothetical protein
VWECLECHRPCTDREVALMTDAEGRAVSAFCSEQAEEEEEEEAYDEASTWQVRESKGILIAEDVDADKPGITVEAVDAFSGKILHAHHYVLCNAREELARHFIDMQDGESGMQCFRQAVEAKDRVVPTCSDARAVYYDDFAQMCVFAGDIKSAQAAYRTAYQVSCVSSGERSPATLQLLALSRSPPKSIHQLMSFYSGAKEFDQTEVFDNDKQANAIVDSLARLLVSE